MATINFNELNCKPVVMENQKFDFNGAEIQVLQYLSVKDKIDLINVALEKADEGLYFDPIKLDMYCSLNMAYLYTNVVFSKQDRLDEEELFDTLSKGGFFDKLRMSMNIGELAYIENSLCKLKEDKIRYKGSFNELVSGVIERVPQMVEKMKTSLESLTPEKMEELKTLAAAFSGKEEN